MLTVLARNMEIGKWYKVNGSSAFLKEKTLSGLGGSGSQEPYYKLIFIAGNNTITHTKDWDDTYEEVIGGGR
jgi:hypothetical protein